MADPIQLHNAALEHLASASGAQWDDGTTQFVWVLLDNAYTQSDADTTWLDIKANEIDDTVQTDYVRQAVSNRTVTTVAGAVEYHADTADFGDDVTLTARFFACVHCAAGSLNLADADIVIGVVDLGAEKSSENNDFDLAEPSTGWFYVGQAD